MKITKRLRKMVLCICLVLIMLCVMLAATMNTCADVTPIDDSGVSAPSEENNLISNPSFDIWREDSTGYLKAPYWSASWTEGMTKETEKYTSAPFAMSAVPAAGSTINARQYVEVEPGTPYRFSIQYYTEDAYSASENVQVTFGYYNNSSEIKSVRSAQNFKFKVEKNGEWAPLILDFETPQDCGYLWICLYVVHPAAGIIDDVSLTKTGPARVAYGDTDGVFYYKEEIETGTQGNAVVTLNSAHIKEAGDVSTYRAALTLQSSTGEALYASGAEPFTEGEAALTFPLSAITALQEKHTLCLSVTNGAGTLWTDTHSVYVYPRPLTLDVEGNYYRQEYETDELGEYVQDEDGKYIPKLKNGSYVFETEPFQPSVVYHVDRPKVTTPDEDNTYLQAARAGANLIQFQSYYATPEAVKGALDDCAKYGLMALVCLNHDNATPAGSTVNAANTAEVVRIAKNHPAAFGYIVMDEPFSHMTDTMLAELENSYRIIRNEDAVHPIFITDNNINYLKEHARYTDIMSIDPYPQSAEKSAYYVRDRITAAKAFSGMRPVYAILQAFPYGSVNGGPQRGLEAYIPTGAQYLHMWYQAMLAGAKGVGFYELYTKSTSYGPYWLYKTPELAELWGTMTDFADNEMEKSYTFFQNSSVIKTVEGEACTVQLRNYDGETYAVVLSKSHTLVDNAVLSVDCVGKIQELYAGTSDNDIKINGDIWTMQLAPSAASIYRLQTEGIIISRNGMVVQNVEKEQSYTVEVNAMPKESGTVRLVTAVYQDTGVVRELLQIFPITSDTAIEGEALDFSGTFIVPATLSGANEVKVFLLSGETLRTVSDAVSLPVK